MDRDADAATLRFQAPCAALVAVAKEAGQVISAPEALVQSLCAAAEELELFVTNTSGPGPGADESGALGAWCTPSGDLIGYGSLESCGAGVHGFHTEPEATG